LLLLLLLLAFDLEDTSQRPVDLIYLVRVFVSMRASEGCVGVWVCG
jgi:hypothetical protein